MSIDLITIAAQKYGHNDVSRQALVQYARKLDPTSSKESAFAIAGLVQKKARQHLSP